MDQDERERGGHSTRWVTLRIAATGIGTVVLLTGAVVGFAQFHRSAAPAAAATRTTPSPSATTAAATPSLTPAATPTPSPSATPVPPTPTAVRTPVPTPRPTPRPTSLAVHACGPRDFAFSVHAFGSPSKWSYATWSMQKVSSGKCELGSWSVTLHVSGAGAAGDGNGPSELLSQGQSIPGPGSDPLGLAPGTYSVWATSSTFGSTNTVSVKIPK